MCVLLFFGLCVQAQAKIIIVASQGGKDVLYESGKDGNRYDPINKYSGLKPSKILIEHSFMPAVACLINRDAIEYVSARISENTPRIDPMVYWVFGEYDPGDKLFLLGYSAGAKFVIDLARELQNADIGIDKIDGMFLVDAVVFETGYRNIPDIVQHLGVYYQRLTTTNIPLDGILVGRQYFNGPGARYFPNHPKEINGVHHQNIDNSPFVLYDISTKIKAIIDEPDDEVGIGDSPLIFTSGNHIHVIHSDYRCSKEIGGPVLCWEAGGTTNCWDAQRWYEFNGSVGNIQHNRTNSGWITTLDRSMCAVVYNSNGSGTSTGGDASSITEGTGNGYTNDQYSNPWAGYDHDVGLSYLKIGKKSSNHWTGSKVWSINQIPDKRDFRVKLKRKGGKWKDVCAEVWFSHNKYFTDDDKYLGKECKKLSKKKYRKKKKKSVYVKNISIPKMEAGKNYYFFTRVTYHGGVNPSSRSDRDEYVKVEIIDFSSKFKIDKISGETPLTINFTNQSKVIKNDGVSGTVSYSWDFGDGSTSTAIHPSHTYTQVGTYIAKLTTTVSWGEVKTSTAIIVANEAIPNPPTDTDLDGVIDDNELGDTDGDGIFDYQESYLVDTDNDGVNDQLDSENTNPANDSDADGYTNEEEKLANTNPLNVDSVPNIPDDNDEGDDPVDLCQETAETATNGGWGWNSVTEEGCLVNYSSDDGSDENDSDDYCHETADTATNGGWGWNPVAQEGCLVVTDSNDNPDEGNCEATADTATNGGWGWNSVTQEGCLVNGTFDETEDDNSNPEDYCHETSDTATNGGWGWNPVTQQGCLVDGSN